MADKQLRFNDNNPRLTEYRCFGCLTGTDRGKRDCALRRLLAEGLLPAPQHSSLPSSKTAH